MQPPCLAALSGCAVRFDSASSATQSQAERRLNRTTEMENCHRINNLQIQPWEPTIVREGSCALRNKALGVNICIICGLLQPMFPSGGHTARFGAQF
eukprot:6034986-Amphidinium_carterae.1